MLNVLTLSKANKTRKLCLIGVYPQQDIFTLQRFPLCSLFCHNGKFVQLVFIFHAITNIRYVSDQNVLKGIHDLKKLDMTTLFGLEYVVKGHI